MSANAVNTFGNAQKLREGEKSGTVHASGISTEYAAGPGAAVFPAQLCQFGLAVHVADVADRLRQQAAVGLEFLASSSRPIRIAVTANPCRRSVPSAIAVSTGTCGRTAITVASRGIRGAISRARLAKLEAVGEFEPGQRLANLLELVEAAAGLHDHRPQAVVLLRSSNRSRASSRVS